MHPVSGFNRFLFKNQILHLHIASALKNVDPSVIAKLPAVSQLTHSVSRYRRKDDKRPKVPSNLEHLVLTDEHVKTAKGDQFLLFDNENPDSRILMFSTHANLQFLTQCVE